MIIEDHRGFVIGAYLNNPIQINKQFYGNLLVIFLCRFKHKKFNLNCSGEHIASCGQQLYVQIILILIVYGWTV